MRWAIAIGAAACAALPAFGLEFDLPGNTALVLEQEEPLGTYALPVGPWQNGAVDSKMVEGRISRQVWHLQASELTTMQIVALLRDQIAEAGYDVLFECQSDACGGFDFRYGTSILPEPEMHVDLGDFRFLSAERGDNTFSITVSRSANTGFIQLTTVGPPEAAIPQLTPSTKILPPMSGSVVTDGLAEHLEQFGGITLEDLTFETGTSTLGDAEYESLNALALYLKENPARQITLVGHTDTVGSLDGNIALSRRRAQAVADHLVTKLGVEAAQLRAEGVGFLAPRNSNQNEEGRESNRRVEAILLTAD